MSRLHRPRAGFWIRLCVVVLYPLNSLLFKITYRHLDRIPAKGGVLVVANHNSYADTIFMARLIWQAGRIPRFLIKSSVFGKPVIGRAMSGAGQIPVIRGTSDAVQSLHAAKAALDAGHCVIIYPEGTLTTDPDGWPMRGKTGVARLALMAPDAPVVPIGQFGTQAVLDTKRRRFRPFPAKPAVASVGEPVDLSDFRGREPGAELLRAMTDRIMAAVTAEVREVRGAMPPVR